MAPPGNGRGDRETQEEEDGEEEGGFRGEGPYPGSSFAQVDEHALAKALEHVASHQSAVTAAEGCDGAEFQVICETEGSADVRGGAASDARWLRGMHNKLERMAEPKRGAPTSADRLLSLTAASPGGCVYKVVVLLLVELSAVTVLVPLVFAFVSHGQASTSPIPSWEVWLLRPLYALFVAKVASTACFALLLAAGVSAGPNTRVAAFKDGPLLVLLWHGLMALLMEQHIPFDAAAWGELALLPWLGGLFGWYVIAAVAVATLRLLLQHLFLVLLTRSYGRRLQSAIVHLRLVRGLFRLAATTGGQRRRAQRAVPADEATDEDEDAAPVDGLLSQAHNYRVVDQATLMRRALSTAAGFASTIVGARRRARKAFRGLLAGARADDRGPDGRSLEREALVRRAVQEAAPQDGEDQEVVEAMMRDLLGGGNSPVAEGHLVAVVEKVYSEQRFLQAALQSFDSLNARVRTCRPRAASPALDSPWPWPGPRRSPLPAGSQHGPVAPRGRAGHRRPLPPGPWLLHGGLHRSPEQRPAESVLPPGLGAVRLPLGRHLRPPRAPHGRG